MNKWTLVQLDEIARLQSGVGFPLHLQGNVSGRYPLYKVGDISRKAREGMVVLGRAQHYVSDEDLTTLGARPLPKGTIVFAKIGEAIKQNFLAVTDCDSLIDNNAMGVIPDSDQVYPKFLFQYLKTVNFYRLADKTSVPSIRKSTLERLIVPLPSKSEQRRIAAVLDDADALRVKRRETLTSLDRLSSSMFLEMFGDPQVNKKGWTTCDLGLLIIEGPQNGLYRPAEDYGTGTPILRIDAFYDGRVTSMASLKRLRLPDGELLRYGLAEGDIVINRVNSLEYLGKSAIIPTVMEPTVFESNMMRFRVDPSRLNGVFLMELLQTDFIKHQILSRAKNAVNQSSINQSDVRSLQIIVPPLNLQLRFSERARAVDEHTKACEKSRVSLDLLFSSLQNEAFRGARQQSNASPASRSVETGMGEY